MKYKFICCDVFFRQACLICARTPNTIDLEFIRLGAHEAPGILNYELQQKIDAADASGKYDAILLGYGLCGNGTAGITARTAPLVIPRAHDCCTIFLGSRGEFVENFGNNLSAEWGCAAYMEKSGDYLRQSDTGKLLGLDKELDELIEKYGEENAQFIWETLHPEDHSRELTYIELPEFEPAGSLESFKRKAEDKGKETRVLKANMRLLEGLVNGEWNEEEYLIVPPGRKIVGIYDHDRIVGIE